MKFELPDLPSPFHLEAVVKTHGWFQLAPFAWDEDRHVLDWAMQGLTKKPLHVRLGAAEKHRVERPRLEVEVRSRGEVPESAVISRIRTVFNLDLDLAGFYGRCRDHPLLKEVPKRGMGRLMKAESVYEDVFKSICGTNVNWKQAVRSVNLIATLEPRLEGDSCRPFPRAETVLEAGERFLKETGRVGYRSGYLIDLCRRFRSGIDDPDPAEMPAGEARKYFESFAGVGKTTARYLAALYGHFDHLAVDSAVISYAARVHFDGRKPKESEVEALYSSHGRWKFLAYWMEFILNGGWSPD